MIRVGNSPPPPNNANFAWVQHIIYRLSPTGIAGFVLANGSMTSQQSNEGEIRKKIIEERLIDCMVALPGQLFYSTQIPACLWFISRYRGNGKFRDRLDEILFINASQLGQMVSRTHRELLDNEINLIAETYHAWREETSVSRYADIAGFCKSVSIQEIRKHDYMLTPGRYVGVEFQEEDTTIFQSKMSQFTSQWYEHQRESIKLAETISINLELLGFESKKGQKDII